MVDAIKAGVKSESLLRELTELEAQKERLEVYIAVSVVAPTRIELVLPA